MLDEIPNSRAIAVTLGFLVAEYASKALAMRSSNSKGII